MQPWQASPEQQAQRRAQPPYVPPQSRGGTQQPPGELGEPTLVMLSDPGAGRGIPVPSGGVTLGRIDQLGPPFTTDESVSRKHALVRRRGDGSVEVADLGSTNGTYLNGRKVASPTPMRASDVLRIGHIELRLDAAGAGAISGEDTAIAGTRKHGVAASPGAGEGDQGAWLVEQARPHSSSSWALAGDRLTIGRDLSSDIALDDSSISRHHADLVRRGQNWSIIDAGSTNGTRVDGESVHQRALRPGSRIEVGNVELVLRTPAANLPDRGEGGVSYDIGAQAGNISNVAGNQANYYQESNLRFIASRRGVARRLMVSGLLLFLAGRSNR